DVYKRQAYVKPHLHQNENPRFDLGSFNELSSASAHELLARTRCAIPEVDVLIINQQLLHGIHTTTVREGIKALVRECENCIFVADTRHHGDAYPGAVLKLNEHEALRVCGLGPESGRSCGSLHAFAAADMLFRHQGRPVVVTRSSRGVILRDLRGLHPIPAPLISGPTDPVGAGDSFLAGFCLGLATGCEPHIAAQFGNLVAGVTVQKLYQTGTASAAEVLSLARSATYPRPG
ncbi:MAG: PfkB family carbohydrate kinase, partial [Kiritimatiellae bacterium]|nr:PfkB family carbohydrate kinase [Kiritimatiellia bacterium]